MDGMNKAQEARQQMASKIILTVRCLLPTSGHVHAQLGAHSSPLAALLNVMRNSV
jgi:hypothetical protein